VAVKSSNLVRATWPRVRPEKKHGKSGYVVDARGKSWVGKQREWFPTKAEAKDKAQQIASDCWSLGFQSAAFKAKDSGTFKVWSSLIEQTCKEFKLPELSLESLIELAREGRKVQMKAALVSHVPSVLLAADQYYNEKIAPYGGKGGKTLSKDGKRDAQQAKKYLTKAWPWKKVNAVTHQMADTYFKTAKREDGKPLSQQSRRTRLTQFKMFFKWCMSPKRKWIAENPCDDLSFTVERGEVQTLGTEDVARLLNAAWNDTDSSRRRLCGRDYALPGIVLSLFAGLRPWSEAAKMYWEDIDWNLITPNGSLTIKVRKSKTRFHYAELHPTGIEWLKLCAKKKGPIKTHENALERVREKVGLGPGNWAPDVLRHTYASNWYATHSERGLNALERLMGNSVEVLRKHYIKALAPKEAVAYWEILPSIVENNPPEIHL
jgi:integrase